MPVTLQERGKIMMFSKESITTKLRQIAGLQHLKNQNKSWFKELTEREVEILTLLASGLNNPDIARQLDISRVTVQNHRSSIRSKLNISNQAEYIKFALAYDLIQL